MLDRDIRLAQSPIQVWGMHFETELAKIAIVLLQTPSSEAAVERTFSAQNSIHRKKRNRLHSDSVEASMFVAFNHALLTKPISEAPPAVRVIELSIDFHDPQTDDDSEVEVDEVSMDDEEEDVEMEDASSSSEYAHADAASVTTPQRVATAIFLDDFIRENQLNVKSHFTCDLEARLTEEARVKNAGGKSTKALLKAIRDKLKSTAAAADAPAAAAAE
jgi:hAT family C-terminal dimerisation region